MIVSGELEQRLIEHESAQRFVYKDAGGFFTIGYGRNIDERSGRGLTPVEQLYLMKNDLDICYKELSPYGWYQTLDTVRQEVLIEMCFNMGLPALLLFKNMIAALTNHDYKNAVNEMLNSVWANQIGKDRLTDMTNRMLTGNYGAVT